MSQSATIHAFPTAAHDVDLEQVHARAGSLDFLADLVDGVVEEGLVEVDEHLPEQLRALADELIDLSFADVPNVLAINKLLARSTDLLQHATAPICRASSRRMLGSSLYDRVATVVMTLGELGAIAFERTCDADASMPYSVAPLRRFLRIAAAAYDWAQWNVDVPVALRAVFAEAIGNAAATARDELGIVHDLAPTDAEPLADALDELHDAWLACAPADVIAEFVAERDRHRSLGDCFDLGVALSIARRLLLTPDAPPLADTAEIGAWCAAASIEG